MKRFICLILSTVLLITSFTINISALEQTISNEETIYFDDGSYITIKLIDHHSRSIITKTKVATYNNSNGEPEWSAELSGIFRYDGTTSTCESASCSITIFNNKWYEIENIVTRSNGSAAASLKMGYQILGITFKTIPIEISLTCDKNGNFS